MLFEPYSFQIINLSYHLSDIFRMRTIDFKQKRIRIKLSCGNKTSKKP